MKPQRKNRTLREIYKQQRYNNDNDDDNNLRQNHQKGNEKSLIEKGIKFMMNRKKSLVLMFMCSLGFHRHKDTKIYKLQSLPQK